MRIYFLLCLSFFVLSCKQTTQQKSEETIETTKASEIVATETTEALESDCIFDTATQTDEFLKEIQEFENYTWNKDKHVATILLQNKDTLLITRGGCYSFCMEMEYHPVFDKTDYSKTENCYAKLMGFAKLLGEEFDTKLLKEELKAKHMEVQSYGSKFEESGSEKIITFIGDNMLSMKNYYFIIKEKKKRTTLSLGWAVD